MALSTVGIAIIVNQIFNLQILGWRPISTAYYYIVLGLFMTGVFRLPLFQRTLQFTPKVQGGSPLSATVFGVSFAIGWTPCIGPILGAILMATSSAASAQAGMIYLSAYSAGLALPFLASTLLINRCKLQRRAEPAERLALGCHRPAQSGYLGCPLE